MRVPDLADFAGGPDRAHAAIAQAALDHIEQLADSFLLGQTAADFAQTVLQAMVPLQQLTGALAAANRRIVTDGATTASSETVTSASAQFAAYDQGRPITGGSLPAGTTISAVVDAATVTVSQPAAADGTALTLTIG